ncbi:MAG: 5'-deoxyadenosine deaminase [candidate division KSB1 bacterium]|nr:5'-deoxyadenosine deaminase [candidate division KSB1 bacterium]
MSAILLKNALLATMNSAREVFRGDILVEKDRITEIRRVESNRQTAPSSQQTKIDRTIDASRWAILPGFIQTHVHLCQTLFRNHAEDLPLLDWLRKKIWPFEAAHNATSMRLAARLGIAELLASGTTTILDMGSVHHYDVVFEELQQWGVRAVGGKCMMDAGEAVPPALLESTRDSLSTSRQLVEAWHGAAGGRLRYAFAPRFALSCSEPLLREVSQMAKSLGCMIHTHAAETAAEEALLLKEKKQRSISFFREMGITGPRCCLAHGVQAEAQEISLLAQESTRVTHCPGSNAKLGSGIAPVVSMRRAGVVVGIGADGAPCNNRLDIFAEMRLAALLQKIRYGVAAMPAKAIVEMATIDGARALNWAAEIGSLEIGKKADLVAIDLDTPHASPTNGEDLYASIVYAAQSRDVRLTMIDGRICFENDGVAGMDTNETVALAKEEWAKLLQRATTAG